MCLPITMLIKMIYFVWWNVLVEKKLEQTTVCWHFINVENYERKKNKTRTACTLNHLKSNFFTLSSGVSQIIICDHVLIVRVKLSGRHFYPVSWTSLRPVYEYYVIKTCISSRIPYNNRSMPYVR